MNFVHWAQQVFSTQELDGVLASTSICFDLSVFEIFVPLSVGGKIILAENALQSRLCLESFATVQVARRSLAAVRSQAEPGNELNTVSG